MTEPEPKVIPLSADWPGRGLPLMPGDFSRYVPHGMGIGAPMIVRPWDDPLRALSGPNYYGLEAPETDPVRGAPTQYAGGGVIYFDENVPWERLEIALSVMGVRFRELDYVVIARQADDPMRDRYLDQVRIGSRHGLGQMFEPGPELGQLPKQPVPIEGYIQQFMAEQREKWTSFALRGTAGGDGDWAKERLAFGFMVENAYWQIYRMWSRSWLITK
jgi:hypothetical protein